MIMVLAIAAAVSTWRRLRFRPVRMHDGARIEVSVGSLHPRRRPLCSPEGAALALPADGGIFQ